MARLIVMLSFNWSKSLHTLPALILSDSNQPCGSRMEVSDPIIVAVLDQVLQDVAGRQVDAFEKRCEELPLPKDLINLASSFKQQQ